MAIGVKGSGREGNGVSDDPAADLSAKRSTHTGRPPWRKPALIAGGLAAVVAAMVAAGLVALGAGAAGGPVRALLETKLHRPVHFAHLAVSRTAEGLRLVFTDLHVGQPKDFGPGDLAYAPRVELVVRLPPLLAGRLEAPEVTLTSPELHLRRHGPGDDNWTFGHGGGGASGMLGATRVLRITDGRVTMDDPQRRLTLQGAMSNDPGSADLPLHLDGGGVLQGAPYRVHALGGPLNGRKPKTPHAVRVEMQDGATRVRLSGTTQAPFDFRGLDMDVDADGPNLADLVYLFHLLAPNSPPFHLRAHMHREGKRFALTRLDAKLGASDVQGQVLSEHLQRRRIEATLHAHRLTARDLRVLLASPPPHAVTRDRPGVSGKGRTPPGRVFSQTPVSLHRLGGSDAALTLRVDAVEGFGLPVNNLDLRLRAERGRLTVAPLAFSAAGGTVRIDYALDTTAKAPPAQLTARVRGLQLGRTGRGGAFGGRLDAETQVRGAGLSVAEQAATAGGRATLRLTSASLPRKDAAALSGDLLGLVASLLQPKSRVPLRCVSADFAVASGVARATRLVVATGEGTATGGGEIDLRDEQVRLRLEASSRGPGPLLRLPIPIVVDGPISKPHPHAQAPRGAGGPSGLLRSLGRLVGPRPSGPPAPTC